MIALDTIGEVSDCNNVLFRERKSNLKVAFIERLNLWRYLLSIPNEKVLGKCRFSILCMFL